MKTDVVVCGAGVAGLAAACALGGLGLQVLVVDKQRQIPPVAKGEVLQPGSFEILRAWGAQHRLERLGAVPMSRLVTRDERGEAVMTIDYDRLPEPDRSMLTHDYSTILRVLEDCLPPTVELRRNVRVGEPLADATGRVVGVRLTEDGRSHELPAELVVAADGLASRLRAAAGIPVRRLDYPHRLVSFEIEGVTGIVDALTTYLTNQGLWLLYPLPGNRLRVWIQAEPDELRGMKKASLTAWCRQRLVGAPGMLPIPDALLADLRQPQVLPLTRFLAPRLAVAGMVLVGEAAHSVHPITAQGMNSSIGDAAVLGTVLGRVLGDAAWTSRAVDAALMRYEAERMPVLTQIEQMSHRVAEASTTTAATRRRLNRRIAARTGRNPRLLHKMAHNLAGLDARPFTALDRLHQIGLLPDVRLWQAPWARQM